MADNNLFGQAKEKGKDQFQDKVDTHSKAILTVTQRQKDLESSLDLLSEKLDLVDHNTVKNFRKMTQDLKDIRHDVKELKADIEGLREFNTKVTKQLKLMTTKDEVQKLEKYIDLWEPMQFLTRDELEEFRSKIKKDFEEIIESFLKDDTDKKKH